MRSGLVNAVKWVKELGFTNVVLEVANEFAHGGFDHAILKTSRGEAELIALAKKTYPKLLVSTSGMGSGRLPDDVAQASDFLLIHFNSTKLAEIPQRIADLKKYGKPIVCNEDDKVGVDAQQAAELSVANGASWGFMHSAVNQYFPKLSFNGTADDPVVYACSNGSRRMQGDISHRPMPTGAGGEPQDAAEVRRVAGMDRRKLDETFEFIKGSTKNGGLLVVRNGWLVYENYFGLGHRDATPNLASCGKSFTSIAVGILLAEQPSRFPDGLDQKVFTPDYFPPEAFPLSDPRKKEIKLGQLLAFTAGIRGNNPSYVQGRETTIDPVGPDGWQSIVEAFALGKQDGKRGQVPFSTATLWCDPGEGYSYASASIHLASIMLRHVARMELEAYVEKHLARPLGWGRWGYGYKQAAEVTHTPGGGGIALRATDMLRFGYLLLREGRWNDAQVVPAEYVRPARQVGLQSALSVQLAVQRQHGRRDPGASAGRLLEERLRRSCHLRRAVAGSRGLEARRARRAILAGQHRTAPVAGRRGTNRGAKELEGNRGQGDRPEEDACYGNRSHRALTATTFAAVRQPCAARASRKRVIRWAMGPGGSRWVSPATGAMRSATNLGPGAARVGRRPFRHLSRSSNWAMLAGAKPIERAMAG